MENHFGRSATSFSAAPARQNPRHGVTGNPPLAALRRDHVLQGHAGDVAFAETTIAQAGTRSVWADHAAAPNQNMQDPLLLLF